MPVNSGVAVGLGLDRVGCGASVMVALAVGVGLGGRGVAVAAVVAAAVGLGGREVAVAAAVAVGVEVAVGKGDAVGTGVCVGRGVFVASATFVGGSVGGTVVGVEAKGRVQPAKIRTPMASKMVKVPRFVCLIPPSFSGQRRVGRIGL